MAGGRGRRDRGHGDGARGLNAPDAGVPELAGRDLLDSQLMAMTAQDRWRISAELRERGFALAWDQLDRAGPLGPVERVMFLIDRLYPEMPAAHRAMFQLRFQAELDAGRWHGPVRPGR